MEDFLDRAKQPANTLPKTFRARSNVEQVLTALKVAGHDPLRECFVVNAHGSPSRV